MFYKIGVAGWGLQLLLKWDFNTRCFPVNLANFFKSTQFYRTLPVAASGKKKITEKYAEQNRSAHWTMRHSKDNLLLWTGRFIYFFFFFDLSGIYDYSPISKLLHETQVHVAKRFDNYAANASIFFKQSYLLTKKLFKYLIITSKILKW